MKHEKATTLHELWTPELLRWRLAPAPHASPSGECENGRAAVPDATDDTTPDTSLPDSSMMETERPAPDTPRPPASVPAAEVRRLVRMAGRTAQDNLLMLGLPRAEMIRALLEALPERMRLIICVATPDTLREALAAGGIPSAVLLADTVTVPVAAHGAAPARAASAGAASLAPCSRLLLLADTSPWALLLLLHSAGVTTQNTAMSFAPGLPPAERGPLRQLQRMLVSSRRVALPGTSPRTRPAMLPESAPESSRGLMPGTEFGTELDISPRARHDSHDGVTTSATAATPAPLASVTSSDSGPGAPSLHLCAILHPEEPEVASFFAHIPSWISGVTVVWDGAPPSAPVPCPVPLHQTSRPLGGNFAAQRNAMLDAAPEGWLVYLDADERLSPAAWDALRRWVGHAAACGASHMALPRRTFLPDGVSVRFGFGLWPDLQVRVFLKSPGVRFTGRIHERLTGTCGGLLLLPGHPILHYSLMLKDRAAIEARLRVFDGAAGRPLHHFSACYPGLPLAPFEEAEHLHADTALLFDSP